MQGTQNDVEIIDEGMDDTGEFRFCCCLSMSRG